MTGPKMVSRFDCPGQSEFPDGLEVALLGVQRQRLGRCITFEGFQDVEFLFRPIQTTKGFCVIVRS